MVELCIYTPGGGCIDVTLAWINSPLLAAQVKISERTMANTTYMILLLEDSGSTQ